MSLSLSLNPHVREVHIPAHVLGFIALLWAISTANLWVILWFLVFNFWYSGLGMSIGFHRYFTHRAFETTRFWRMVMLWGGTFAGQGSAVFWVALHRLHHANTDKEPDIHSPKIHGFWHAYVGWIFTIDPRAVQLAKAADTIRDPLCRFTHRHYNRIMWAWWAAWLLSAWLFEAVRPVAAGMLIAGAWAINQEALINSVCHDPRYGVTHDDSRDHSRNVHGLHWLTWGQSLHNNHHVDPRNANFGDPGGHDIGHRIIRLIAQPAP